VFVLLAFGSVVAFSGLFVKTDLPAHWKRVLWGRFSGRYSCSAGRSCCSNSSQARGEDYAISNDLKPMPTITPTPTPDTDGVTLRRSTEDNPLVLTAGYAPDLDSKVGNWDVQEAYQGQMVLRKDVHFTAAALSGDLAVVSGSDNYETCQNATAYQPRVTKYELEPGMKLCVRTTEKRLAFVAIKKISGSGSSKQIGLDVKVWDPPLE
jgi:hypothetical protein